MSFVASIQHEEDWSQFRVTPVLFFTSRCEGWYSPFLTMLTLSQVLRENTVDVPIDLSFETQLSPHNHPQGLEFLSGFSPLKILSHFYPGSH